MALVDVKPYRWDRYEETRPGELTITFYGSPHPGFYDVDRVEVVEEGDEVVVTVFVGNDPDVRGHFTMQAVELALTVNLSGPLAGRRVVDGAPA